MHHHHKWSIEDLEDLVPFELDIYVALTKQHIEKLQAAKSGGGNDAYQGPPPAIEKRLRNQKLAEFKANREAKAS